MPNRITQSDWLNILVFVGKAGQSRREADRSTFVETPLLFHLRRPPRQAEAEVGGGAPRSSEQKPDIDSKRTGPGVREAGARGVRTGHAPPPLQLDPLPT